MYIVYIRERYNFSLVCTSKRALNLIIDVLVSSTLNSHSLLSHGHSPQQLPCPFLLRFAFRLQVLQSRGSRSPHGLP